MAASRRRSTTATAARVALILALNAVAALALIKIWPSGGSQAATVPEPARDDVALDEPPPRAVVPAVPPLPQAEHAALERDLRAIVERFVEQARVKSGNKVHGGNTSVAIHVRELGAGAAGEIALGSDRPMRPASNLKLVTTAAALVLLGPDWQFETRFESRGAVVEGVLDGDLIVRASGDPLFDAESRGDVEHLLRPAIDELAARGLRVIHGDVVLDEGAFLVPGPAPEWPKESQYWTEYCALAGGFSANRGCLCAVVSPARNGAHARVEILPRDHGLPENVGVRTEPKGGPKVKVDAKPSGVMVTGSIGSNSAPYLAEFAHPDPVELFGRSLCGALARRGVLLEGRLRRERGVARGERLAVLRSPLAKYFAPINADSNNAVADQVFFATANAAFGEGTREAGARATRAALERLGVPVDGFVQVDGSGLSRANRVTARQVAALIEAVLLQDERSAAVYRESLAVAGERGTLSDRMEHSPARGRVRAKTGFIDGTSALSGIADAADGRQFVFSILVNFPIVQALNPSVWKPMQDAVCERLVRGRP